jgi:hypothetical protein
MGDEAAVVKGVLCDLIAVYVGISKINFKRLLQNIPRQSRKNSEP